MLRHTGSLLVIAAILAVMSPICMVAQENPNDLPLGDVARNFRKKNPVAKPIIDDDELPHALERAENSRFGSAFKYLMAAQAKGFQLASPDVTCSLSFSANVKSLLSAQFAQTDLPPDEMAKLQAQATIEGDAMTVPVFNGTDWHVSELAVALTVIRRKSDPTFPGAGDIGLTGSEPNQNDSSANDPLEQVRAEKKPDVTVLYRMRTAAPPWERAVFSAPLNLDVPPGTEWHWAIVQAKGYPPESFAASAKPAASKQAQPVLSVPMSLTDPENPLGVTPQLPR